MRIKNVETKLFFTQFLGRLFVHNFLKDSQVLLPRGDYERRHGKFPRYFSGWYLFVPAKDLAPGEVIHKKLNGLDLICYRNKAGTPVVHTNRCPHMDGSFAPMGKVNARGQLVCAYHRYAYENGKPMSGSSDFRNDPSKCIPTHPVREVNGLVMWWFDAKSFNGVGVPQWELDLPDVSRYERFASMRSITPTHMAPLHENIIDDQHFMLLHGSNRYRSELLPYDAPHRFRTRNTMTVPMPKLGPFKLAQRDTMDVQMDTDFHGLGIHINFVKIHDWEVLMIHCTTPIEDEVTEWTLNIYMPKRIWKLKPTLEMFLSQMYPWGAYAQTYYLHTQDRRVFFESAPYNFYKDVPKGHEKVNAFRRWIQTELLGEERPMNKNCIPTLYQPKAS